MEEVRDTILKESIPRLLWRYSIPAMLGMMLHAANALIDRFFIGDAVGETGLAALSVSFPLFTVLLALCLWVASGASTAISLAIGKGDNAGVSGIYRSGIIFACLLLPLIGFIFIPLLDPLLSLSGGDSVTIPHAKEYLIPILVGYLAWSFSAYISSVMRSFDKPKVALIIVSISPVLNIVFDYLFLMKWQLGMQGAGLATILSYVFSAVVGLILWQCKVTLPRLDSRAGIMRAGKTILAFGLSLFLLQICGAAFHAMSNFQANEYGGTEGLAILGVVFALAGFIFMPVVGIGQGMQPIIGVNSGGASTPRVMKTLRYAITYSTIIITAIYCWIMMFPAMFLKWFFTDAQLPNSIHAARICFSLMPVIAFQIIIIHYFQAVGAPARATWLVICRQLVLLPVLLFLLPQWYQLDGVWLVSPVSDGIMFLITLVSFILYFRKPCPSVSTS